MTQLLGIPMNTRRQYGLPRQGLQRRSGALLPMIVLVLVILFVSSVLSIDIAYMHATRAELRTATDAAARAGTEALGRLQDRQAALDAAIDTASLNMVAGKPLILEPGDIEFGNNVRDGAGRFRFVPGDDEPNSIRVTGRRTADSPSGGVNLFFGPLLGVSHFQPIQSATASSTTRDIALVLDISGSMNRRSGSGTRLSALKQAVNIFIDEINESSPNSQMSLSTYSTTANQRIELTPDLENIRSYVNDLRARGYTAIGEGLLVGSDSLVEDANARPFSAKTVVVMTDGNHNTGPSPTTTVHTAVARDQVVHTITFSRGANRQLMADVADLGNGKHIHASDNAELNEAFREIAQTISVILTD